MEKMSIRKDDTVVVISGKDKGKKGKVLTASPKEGTVIIHGVNVAKKHKKPRKQNEAGGIITKENPIQASNVMLFCAKCNKATRVAKKVLEDGKKVRVCKKCGAAFED